MSLSVQNVQNLLEKPEARHWVWYAAKAAALLLLLGAFAVFGSHMHAFGVALLWVLLSCISALGYAYFHVIVKASKRYLFEPGRQFSRVNSGRVLAFIIAFVAAVACVFSLFSDALRWNAIDWGIVASGAIFYPLAYFALRRLIGGQFTEEFRQAGVTRATIWATIVYLCAAFLAASLAAPAIDYSSAYEAFAVAQQEFGDSPAELLRQLGILSSVADGMTNWTTSQAASTSPYLYAALKIFLNALSLAAVGSLLGACSISKPESERMFADFPGDANGGDRTKPALRWRYTVAGACMPVLLFALLLGLNSQLQGASDRGELSFVENFASGAINLIVCTIDGETYDAQALQAAKDEALGELSKLSAETKESLVPLVNASFDARIANVDGYLDDYYSLPADYERLVNLVGGNVEEFAAQRLQEKIDADIDDSELTSKLEEYRVQSQAILDRFEDAKVSSKIEGAPEWITKSKSTADSALFDATVEPNQELLSLEQRFGVSAASGIAAGTATKVISKKLIKRTMEKQFFKNVVSRITTVLAVRATGGVVGGVVGLAGGPLGTITGIAAGTAASVGIDYALLKVDESQNRESYKEQIVQAIEEERSEMLSLLE
jgi:hypothetical protein